MAELSKGRQKIDKSIFNTQRSTPHAVNTGVDCSGLTNLVYRVNNIDIPRDAQEQWMVTQKVACNSLKPGDLIFISMEGKPDLINHVMLYIGSEKFIEAAETGNTVIVNTFTKRFGEGFDELAKHNFIISNKQIYFGSIISNQ